MADGVLKKGVDSGALTFFESMLSGTEEPIQAATKQDAA